MHTPAAAVTAKHVKVRTHACHAVKFFGAKRRSIGHCPYRRYRHVTALGWISFSSAAQGAGQTPADILGGVSLVVWTITVIVADQVCHSWSCARRTMARVGLFARCGLLHEHKKKRGTTLVLWALMLRPDTCSATV